ncbi:hypothetical protein Dimus_019389 [Dionaea muscipula]
MGKPTGKKNKKPQLGSSSKKLQGDAQSKHDFKGRYDLQRKSSDEDTAVFISMSQELKEQGNKLFQRRDHEGAMLKYEKALKLLPRNHIDVASLRTSMASCYMQMGIGEYPRAINECNLALEVAHKYTKALLKRASCFQALNRLDLAWRDVTAVLSLEPNNLTALEIGDSLKKLMEEKGIASVGVVSRSEKNWTKTKEKQQQQQPPPPNNNNKKNKNKKQKQQLTKVEATHEHKEKSEEEEENMVGDKLKPEEKEAKEEDIELDKSNPEDKEVVQEQVMSSKGDEEAVTRNVKLVLGDDIRWALMPTNCDVLLVRDIVRDRFPNLKGALVKYRDQEGDLITITTTDELRKAEEDSGDSRGATLRLYIVEVDPDEEPVVFWSTDTDDRAANRNKSHRHVDGKSRDDETVCIDNWIVQFAQVFKNHVGFDSDGYLNLHELGMALYSEAMEDTITSDEAQELFAIASEKFQEMAALALFNWGNVHMSKARKRLILQEDDAGGELVASQIKAAYEWAQKEYMAAGMKYQEAIQIKPDFYEGLLALGRQQFEQAKLCWHYAIATKVDLEAGASSEILQLYNKAEDNMEVGMQLWEEMEERRLNGLSKEEKYKFRLQKMGMDGLMKDIPAEEASEQAAVMRSQINILWGTLLYERSVVEFKLELPTWEECLEVAVEKFELAGTSHVDIGVMIKNHISNQTQQEGNENFKQHICFLMKTFANLKKLLKKTDNLRYLFAPGTCRFWFQNR